MSLDEFGLVLPADQGFREWHGYLEVGEQEFKLHLSAGHKSSDRESAKKRRRLDTQERSYDDRRASLCVDKELFELLKGYRGIVQQRLQTCRGDMAGFLTEVKHMTSLALRDRAGEFVSPRPAFYSRIIQELQEVGWDRLVSVNDSLSRICLAFNDRGNRRHQIDIQISADYPLSAPVCSCEMPKELDLQWPQALSPTATSDKVSSIFPGGTIEDSQADQSIVAVATESDEVGESRVMSPSMSSLHPERARKAALKPSACLLGIVQQYEQLAQRLQDFWVVMDDWDSHVWVLEPALTPERPASRASVNRRIAIGRACSLQLTVDPFNPRTLPDCRMFGAERSVRPFLAKLQERGLAMWRKERMPRENFQAILEIDFPTPRNKQLDDYLNMECGICYSYSLQGTAPDKVCDFEKCLRPFHRACLYQWLRALPTTRQSFATAFGQCPYCSNPISCSAPKQ